MQSLHWQTHLIRKWKSWRGMGNIMNVNCKNCGKDFELFISEFCCKECAEEYFMRS